MLDSIGLVAGTNATKQCGLKCLQMDMSTVLRFIEEFAAFTLTYVCTVQVIRSIGLKETLQDAMNGRFDFFLKKSEIDMPMLQYL